ncbi:hypothetical protein NC652_040365 [Populus alba x Populus x berolinensis]|nr:hypothetical protein NC652_040365 [Populus alba x Populus x berolinensis]
MFGYGREWWAPQHPATSKAGVGELAGGCVSSGTGFSRTSQLSAGIDAVMSYQGMELQEHRFPDGDQFRLEYSVMIPSTHIPEM